MQPEAPPVGMRKTEPMALRITKLQANKSNTLAPVINKLHLTVVQPDRRFADALVTQLFYVVCFAYLSRPAITAPTQNLNFLQERLAWLTRARRAVGGEMPARAVLY